ncbi:hypothetical protein [Leptospira santarosai]|uniref:Uncharacterized protein n=2 Tax=Leptospira santarosai TaxID=28183 RepID=M6JG87_9LEPT|nr:hypothetical protein [Leptospira santarosai]EMO57222.1 hypothetical protein LEP1GSC161_0162 [Leptospira santarosai str. CBC1416]EKR91067.1 hypothetical protein LEP1GSC163_3206 [Leptospira santarosai str. CBC379]EMJ45847.1 hypothetical protein LEP1GSC169_0038 [Leptospira santarosai str. HAI1349]EMN20949.1 hypothetical protein LEP1GSC063_3307 [Leptospira santarosai serovar Arenal str. MAVJ 401]EMP81808.1 hypothetical protein LEP1GSC162_1225 [Leptospira santarosai str. CBC1531]
MDEEQVTLLKSTRNGDVTTRVPKSQVEEFLKDPLFKLYEPKNATQEKPKQNVKQSSPE